MNLIATLSKKLEDRRKNDAIRTLKKSIGLVDFSSNDYLGLARNEELQNLVAKEYSKTDKRLGSGGSRLLAGNNIYFEQLEQQLCEIHLGESALLFNSGYTANLAVFSTIPQRGDTIIYDEYIHACVKEGVRLSLAKHFSFAHNDLKALEKRLATASGNKFIAIESIYSMDGDEAPLQKIIQLANKYDAYLIVDEAHSTGNYGPHGSGFCVAQNLNTEVFIRIHTFGKGIGAHGAVVITPQTIKDYLVNFSRQFIYTTSAPVHSLITIGCAYDYLQNHPELIEELNDNIDFFRNEISIETGSKSPIQPVIISGNQEVKRVSNSLQQAGFDVRPVLSPTVQEGSERLRICLHSYNTKEEIRALVEGVRKEAVFNVRRVER